MADIFQQNELIQLHWQWIEWGKTLKTEMRAQRKIKSHQEMAEFIKETKENHPLPKAAVWMACNEKSKYFVGTMIEKDDLCHE